MTDIENSSPNLNSPHSFRLLSYLRGSTLSSTADSNSARIDTRSSSSTSGSPVQWSESPSEEGVRHEMAKDKNKEKVDPEIARLKKELLQSQDWARSLEHANELQHKQIEELQKDKVNMGLESAKRMATIGDLQRRVGLDQARHRDQEIEQRNSHAQIQVQLNDALVELSQANARLLLKDMVLHQEKQSLKCMENIFKSERALREDRDTQVDKLSEELDEEKRTTKEISRENEDIATKLRNIQEKKFDSMEPARCVAR